MAAQLRVIASAALLLLVGLGTGANSGAASLVLASSAVAYLLYALGWLRWRRRARCYEAWVSYVSVAIDVSACYSLAVASFLNPSGVYEVYRSPLLWLLLAAANGLTALRGNARVCWFSCALTLAYGAAMLGVVMFSGSAKWVPQITYLGEGLSLFEAMLSNLFAVLPAIIASWVSRRSSDLVIETAKREQLRDEERAQLEWRLKVADRMVTVGTMAAGVAHEVNNPLTYVLLNLDMLAQRLDGESQPSTLRSYLERAQSGAQRVQTIVASLRTFSRIDEGPEQPVDLRATLDAALTMASSELRHRAQVHVDQAEPLTVLGSEAKLGQVFLNLIINAAQAIEQPDPERQHIRIRLFREDQRAVVEVSDTGSGIAPELLGRIFDPFFTTKPVGSGTGLGLSICHSIISDLSGSIDVRSRPGQGTTFIVRLPRCSRRMVRSSSIRPASPRHLGRVLVVDDDRLVSEAVELMLSEEHKVQLANGAEQALQLLRAGEPFDAVVCDLMMPGMSGIELFHEIETEFPGLAPRVLFATGGAFSRPAQSFVERMGARVINKPFSSEELRAKVHKVVAGSRADASGPRSALTDARDGAAHQ